jgi:hypothetical protein
MLFRLVAAAFERRPLAISSHWPFDQWGRFLPEHTTAVSLLDRLLQWLGAALVVHPGVTPTGHLLLEGPVGGAGATSVVGPGRVAVPVLGIVTERPRGLHRLLSSQVWGVTPGSAQRALVGLSSTGHPEPAQDFEQGD